MMKQATSLLAMAIIGAAAGAQERTYKVADGAWPWYDRVGRWELAKVPKALQSNVPVPQQSCASRALSLPEGLKAVTIAMGRGDLQRLLRKNFPLRETDYEVEIRSPDGKHTLRYPVLVYPNPPAKAAFDGKCGAGIVLLKLDDKGIASRPLPTVPAPAPAPKKTLAERQSFHLYLLIGQSNMAGRGTIEPVDRVINPRVLTLDKENRWVVALDPIHFDKPNIDGVGLGTTFGKVMAGKDPRVVVGLIPCAVGGTTVSQWQKGAPPLPPWGKLYDNAVARAKIALRDGVLKGILWHQGEGDASPAGIAAYREKLTRLVTDLRQDLDAPDVPFVAGDLGVWDEHKDAGRKAFNENLAGLPSWFPHAAVVSSKGLENRGDGTHFNSASLREFGRRYAAAMLKLQGRQ